jgi:N-methylhydantoinase A/oxoprolinase/acetone carboxylase beta subunit
MRRVAGVDVGGAFTDLLLYGVGAKGSRVRLAKILTPAANQAGGVLAAVAEAQAFAALLAAIPHGETAITSQ